MYSIQQTRLSSTRPLQQNFSSTSPPPRPSTSPSSQHLKQIPVSRRTNLNNTDARILFLSDCALFAS